MTFLCPECGKPGLIITSRIELRSDAKWDEIALQLVRCGECGFEGIATYQENRWGSLDSEIVHHYGYRVAPQLWDHLEKTIATCPDPSSDRCTCLGCEELNVTDQAGAWNWLRDEKVANQVGGIFEMTIKG